MDVNAIITMVTDFFSSIPWENVIGGFVGSVEGINWDSLGEFFSFLDFSNGPFQAIADVFAKLFGIL